jgi:glutathione S-transferase
MNGRELNAHDPGFIKLNPNGQVPIIVDEDFVLWESNTIIRYLTARYQRFDLLPKEPRARALVEQWMDWQATDLYLSYREVFYGLVRSPGSVNAERIETSVAVWIDNMRVLNDRLSETCGYVAGATFTLADIPIGIAVNRWFMMPIERPEFAHVSVYYDRLSDREGYRRYGRNGLP